MTIATVRRSRLHEGYEASKHRDARAREPGRAAARDGLDEPWIFSRVPERLPQLCNRSIQAALELDKRVFRPERGTKSLARHHLAGAREQQTKNTVGLVLQLDPNAALPQFRSLSIQFEAAETIFRPQGRLLFRNNI